MTAQTRRFISLAIVLIAAAASSAFVLWVTAHGTGISIDSVVYIETSLSVRQGYGFTQWGNPATHFPPVYPALIAFANLVQGGTLYSSTRFLHAFIMGINTLLMGLAIRQSAQNSIGATIAALALFLGSFPVLQTHAMAWSEPPFITFMLMGFYLLAIYFQKQRIIWLVISALALGLAAVTRYIGITLVPALMLTLWIFSQKPLRQKLVEVITAGAVAITPMAIWSAHNALRASQATDRVFESHLITFQHIKDFVGTMSDYVLPGLLISFNRQLAFVVLVIVLFIIGFVILKRKNYFAQPASAGAVITGISVIFAIIYVPFLATSISFFDYTTPVDSRILLVIYIPLILVAVNWVGAVFHALHKPAIALVFLALLPASVFLNARIASTKLTFMHLAGWGYGAVEWTDSPTYAAAVATPPDVNIYSNGFDHINFQLEKQRARMLPQLKNGATGETNINFAAEMKAMCEEYRAGKAVIVYYSSLKDRTIFPDQNTLEKTCGLSALKTSRDGVVYGVK